MDEREVMLVGFDIYKFVKKICDNICDNELPKQDMTEGEKKTYKLGTDNVLNLLNQTLNAWIEQGGECYHNIVVHVPYLEVMTEFTTIEDILNREV